MGTPERCVPIMNVITLTIYRQIGFTILSSVHNIVRAITIPTR